MRLVRDIRSHGRNLTRKVVEHSIDRKGSPRTFSITLSCVVTSNEEVSGVVAVLHDVTREINLWRQHYIEWETGSKSKGWGEFASKRSRACERALDIMREAFGDTQEEE